MSFWGLGGKKKKKDEPPEIDMARGPPRYSTPNEEPFEFGEGEDYDEEDDFDDGGDYEDIIEEIDMEERGPPTRGDRPPRRYSDVAESSWGKPSIDFQIRKRINRGKNMVKIDSYEDAVPPTRDYVEREWLPVYGGGLYAVYKDNFIVEKFQIDGDPIYEEDIEKEKRRKKMEFGEEFETDGSMLGFVMMMMKKQESELADTRSNLDEARRDAHKAELESIRAEIRAMGKQDNDVTSFMKQMDLYERLADRFDRGDDSVDKLLNSPMVQRAANTMIDKLGEVDFSDPNLFAPRVMVPGQQPQGPNQVQPTPMDRANIIAGIQQIVINKQLNIPDDIIARCVDLALIDPPDDPNIAMRDAISNLDRILDARGALLHLKENVIEGDFTDDDAASFIEERLPRYAEYLWEHDYEDMVKYLEEFDDLPKMKQTVQYARSDEARDHTMTIIKILRERHEEFEVPVEPEMPDMSGMEDRSTEG